MVQPASRRERRRLDTIAEIKTRAWDAMQHAGAGDLSLRQIARQMGMSASGMYRYYASRSELLSELSADAFDSLGDVVADAHDAAVADDMDPLEAFVRIAHAYRDWALTHRAHYALIFATTLPDYAGSPKASQAAMRSFAVLQRLTADAVATDALDISRIADTLDEELRTSLQEWNKQSGQHVPPAAVAAAMWGYTTMHGAISLELNGHLPPPLLHSRAFFDSTVRAMVAHIRQAGA